MSDPFDDAMSDLVCREWAEDCVHWRGRHLTGMHQHWCFDWDGLPIDHSCAEWPCVCVEQEVAWMRAYLTADMRETTDDR